MDILTQGLLGGVLAQSVASKDEKKLATFTGFIAGLLADADILIRSSNDPLLNIEYHRHFTHSLLFIPVGAAIAMILLWPLLRKHLSLTKLYLYCLAGYSMSGVLDACTSYGTHLLWPFTDERVSLSIISIVDPLFSGILLVSLLLGLRLGHRQIAYAGLFLCVTYLGLGFTQQQRALKLAQVMAVERGHSAEQHVIKPTLGNIVLWRSIYIHDDRIYVDAVRLGLVGDNRVFHGESVARFAVKKDFPELSDSSRLYGDIQRFSTFSDGYVAFDPLRNNVLGDLRYSMLPMSVRPLWGIVIDRSKPQQHAEYRFFRDNSQKVRQMFLAMLLGNESFSSSLNN